MEKKKHKKNNNNGKKQEKQSLVRRILNSFRSSEKKSRRRSQEEKSESQSIHVEEDHELLSPLSTNGGEECTICFKEESSFPELSIKCSTHQRHNVCKQCLYTYFKQEIDEGQIVITTNLSSKNF